jgi:hypothetical protein
MAINKKSRNFYQPSRLTLDSRTDEPICPRYLGHTEFNNNVPHNFQGFAATDPPFRFVR